MSKRTQQKALDAQIESLTHSIQSAEALGDITRLLRKKTFEAMLEGEIAALLGYAKHAPEAHHSGNSRNGFSSKTLKGNTAASPLTCPAIAMESLSP